MASVAEARTAPQGPGLSVWSPIELRAAGPSARMQHATLHDPARQRMILFGGFDGRETFGDLWVLPLTERGAWTQLDIGGGPGPRRGATAILDAPRDRMILFGGAGAAGAVHNDVWALSLAEPMTWTRLTPAGLPPPARLDCAAVFESARERLIVFGGFDGGYRNDVWALSLSNGPTWKQIQPAATPPSGRSGMVAAYDPNLARVVIFGGWDGQRDLADWWVLDLSNYDRAFPVRWLPLTIGNSPPARRNAALVVDTRGRLSEFPTATTLVISGGHSAASGNLDDTWVVALPPFVGTALKLVPQGEHPGPRRGHGAIFDPVSASMLVFGGHDGRCLDETWSLHLAAYTWREFRNPIAPAPWTQLSAPAPAPRRNHVAIWDAPRDRMLVHGGSDVTDDDTWALSMSGDGASWAPLRSQGPRPTLRSSSTAVLDAAGDRMIVFGGFHDGRHLDEAWALSLSTSAWEKLAPAGARPTGRSACAASYDPARRRMVVFGGWNGTRYLDDVWTLGLDGRTEWRAVRIRGRSPSPRRGAAVVWDSRRNRLVISGGFDGSRLGDTWALAFDDRGGAHWTRLHDRAAPSPRDGHVAVYDPAGDRMVVFGGNDGSARDELWALSLSNPESWVRVATPGVAPAARSFASAVHDPARNRMLVFGGGNDTGNLSDAWSLTLDPVSPAAGPAAPNPLRSIEPEAPRPASTESALALFGAQPNPAVREFTVAFALPDAAPARLEVFGVAGQRVEAHDVGALGAGRHAVRIGRGGALPAGIYWVRLTRAGRALTSKVALLRP